MLAYGEWPYCARGVVPKVPRASQHKPVPNSRFEGGVVVLEGVIFVDECVLGQRSHGEESISKLGVRRSGSGEQIGIAGSAIYTDNKQGKVV